MVIGQFCDTFPANLDGVGRVAQSYCETLTGMGHDCYYVAPDSPRYEKEYDFPVVLQRSLQIPGEPYRLGMPGFSLGYQMKLSRIPFDIVHAHSPFSAGHEALRVSREMNIPIVATFHSKYRQDFYEKTHSNIIAGGVVQYVVSFYNHCDAVWTVNNATADVLREYGYKGRILIVENGTNPETPTPEAAARMDARLPGGDKPLLIFVGQHDYKKNLHGVLGACALLKRQGRPFSLVTAGIGPDAEAIRREAAGLGIGEDCTFLGFVGDRGELMELYRRADLLVFPSVYDNAPMVLREAAVMETPGVLVRGSCAAEGVTDGMNGFIAANESPEAIAEAVLRGLKTAGPVGQAARQTIPVSWTTIMKQVEEEYRALIDRRKTEKRSMLVRSMGLVGRERRRIDTGLRVTHRKMRNARRKKDHA